MLLVGAGKMSELAARHLMQQGADSIFVTNRTHDRAVRLAQQFTSQAVRFDDLYATADQLTSSSPRPDPQAFSGASMAAVSAQRRNRPMFFIDICSATRYRSGDQSRRRRFSLRH